jgi:hypothetical protein
MSNPDKEYYYAGQKKIKLQRLPDRFAVRYKAQTTSKAMEKKLRKKCISPMPKSAKSCRTTALSL